METLSSENNSSNEMLNKWPIEVNVIINGSQRPPTNNDVPGDATITLEKNYIGYSVHTKETRIFTSLEEEKSNQHDDGDDFIQNESENKFSMDDNFIINVANNEYKERDDKFKDSKNSFQVKDKYTLGSTYSGKNAQCRQTSMLLPEQENIIIQRTTKETNEPKETLNIFLNELYDKQLDLKVKFSNDEEIRDIRDAVVKQTTVVAHTIGEIDSRLRIGEVIPVGSAREGTQIVRPCEYDFILTLDVLSKPGAVSIIPADPDDAKREYMHVKLENPLMKSVFHAFSEGGFIRGSSLSLFRPGIRPFLLRAIQEAVYLCSASIVKQNTGTLKFKHKYKAKLHGPAFMIRLIWESNRTKTSMEISVDLCLAVKLHGVPDKVLPLSNISFSTYKLYAQRVGSVMLIPRNGLRFKVTFTESELMLTSTMSEHHRKCYKILKYIINGEPYPSERSKSKILEYFQDSETNIHSYALKTAIWNHHYKELCPEEHDLGSCIIKIVKILCSVTRTRQFDHNEYMLLKEMIGRSELLSKSKIPCKTRLKELLDNLRMISNTDKQVYNYETCRAAIVIPSHRYRCYKLTRFYLGLSMYITVIVFVAYLHKASGNKVIDVTGYFLFVLSTFCTLWIPLYLRQYLLTLNSSKVTDSCIANVKFCIFAIASIPGYTFCIVYFICIQPTNGLVCIAIVLCFSMQILNLAYVLLTWHVLKLRS